MTRFHDDAEKGAIERAMFTEFAAQYRADVDIRSIRSGDPLAREPDVIAKSTESDEFIACELVRLTETASGVSVDAFARKFDKSSHGLYGGVAQAQLELLAYSDHLSTPWEQVLVAIRIALESRVTGFMRAWLWSRSGNPGAQPEGVWLWEPGRGVIRFD